MSVDVITIGEALLVLRPEGYGILENARRLEVLIGGAELNVAIGLSRLGLKTAWIGKLPRTPIGENILNTIRGLGVDTSRVVWGTTEKVGIMFIELGIEPRPSIAIYDRKGSAGSELSPGDVDWEFVKMARHLHITGITPATSEECFKTTVEAFKFARAYGLSTSFDVNFRSSLWEVAAATRLISEIAHKVDVIFLNRQEAQTLFALVGEPEDVARTICERFGCRVVVLKLGPEGAVACDGKHVYKVKKKYPAAVVNRFGAGDAFCAGFLYGFLKGSTEMGLAWGSAMAAVKLSLSDVNYPLVRMEQLAHLIESDKVVELTQVIESGVSESGVRAPGVLAYEVRR